MSIAVVTGSRGGIGSATAAVFEGAGFNVHGVDVGDDFPDLQRLDALVCTHGISGRSLGDGPVDACTEEAWDAVLDANLKSVFLYAKHAHLCARTGAEPSSRSRPHSASSAATPTSRHTPTPRRRPASSA